MPNIPCDFIRNTRTNINSKPIKDGSLYFTTDTEEILMDSNSGRKLFTKTPYRINIANFTKTLTSQTFKQALMDALKKTAFVYIPEGEYNLKTIGTIDFGTTPCDILCSPKAHFTYPLTSSQAKNALSYLFTIQNSTYFRWEGGKFTIGDSDIHSSKIMLHNSSKGLGGATFFVNNSENVTFDNLWFDYSCMPSAISIQDSKDVKVLNCRMDNIIEAGIHIFRHGQNIIIDGCTMKNIKIPTNYGDMYYCYAVCTGLNYLTEDGIFPPDNLIVRNCFVENSEDSGIDTHGATNVIIENNRIINTAVCITAYNDSDRVQSRPTGWIMENVIIRNNYCKSNVLPPDRPHKQGGGITKYYPDHSYVMLASAKKEKRDTRNYYISNNYFESNNTYNEYGWALMPLTRLTNVEVNNCVFKINKDTNGSTARQAIYCRMSNNINITNCSLIGAMSCFDYLVYVDDGCSVTANNNNSITGVTAKLGSDSSTCSHIFTDDRNNYFQPTLARGESGASASTSNGKFFISDSYYICNRNLSNESAVSCQITSTNVSRIYNVTLSASSSHCPYFHGCGVVVNGREAEVVEILSDNSFVIRADSSVSTGSQTIKMKDAIVLESTLTKVQKA